MVDTRRDVTLERQTTPVPVIVLPLQHAFEVTRPGKGASEVLRYAPAAAPMSYTSATKLTARRLTDGTWSPPVAIPAVTNGLALTAVTGGASVAGRALPGEVAAGADPATVETYLADWKALEGRRFTVAIDPRGQFGDIKFGDDPTGARSEHATEDLQQRLLLTLVSLPDVPVAVGAQWRVITALRQRPFVVKQTAIYTLLARTATSWKIGVEIQRVGEPQTVVDASIPAGTEVELLALVRTYKGTLDVDPTLLVGAGKLDVSSTLHLRITQRMQGSTEQILEDSGTITLGHAPVAP